MKTEAELGVMLPYAEDCLGLPRAILYKEGSSPRSFGPADILISDTELQIREKINFCCLKLPSLWSFVIVALRH